jgi:hypothetical protein
VNNVSDLVVIVLLLIMAVFGGAILEWLDPGRIDERIEYVESLRNTECE